MSFPWHKTPGEWVHDALCAQTDPELFFPTKSDHGLVAKEICVACPVRQPCLDYALDYADFGIWGGMSVNERRRLRQHPRNLRKSS